MTRDQIDILWQRALRESIEEGEMFTRYHFAKLIEQNTVRRSDLREGEMELLMFRVHDGQTIAYKQRFNEHETRDIPEINLRSAVLRMHTAIKCAIEDVEGKS